MQDSRGKRVSVEEYATLTSTMHQEALADVSSPTEELYPRRKKGTTQATNSALPLFGRPHRFGGEDESLSPRPPSLESAYDVRPRTISPN